MAGIRHPRSGSCPSVAHPIDLSVKEFAVLETLLKAAPATLSAEDLLAQAWDENADPFTKTVQVTISRLRRRLGDPPLIETITGVGYRITDHSHQPRP
jgi:DNA-binding response OmpR family regulator